MLEISAMLCTDCYKTGHWRQYSPNTEVVYSTWTPRKSRMEGVDKVVFFGLQYFIKDYLIDSFNKSFFNQPKEEIITEFKRVMKAYTGDDDASHWEALHDLGYLPLQIDALPEGTLTPIRVPMFTIKNTKPEFYWLTNFIETIMSTEIWKPMTSATIALEYRKILDKWAEKTCDDNSHVDFQAHDFSLRGIAGVDAGMSSGAGHLLSFKGTDTIPAILWLEKYYNADNSKEQFSCSIAASEHSVAETNIIELQDTVKGDKLAAEIAYLDRLLTNVYPSGFFSYVSDTYNLWEVCKTVLPALKGKIMARGGRVVVRPDCYAEDTQVLTNSGWKLFKDLKKGVDKVAQYHEDGTIDYTLPLKYVDEFYDGDMYKFSNVKNNIDVCVTPNHRMIRRSLKTGISVRFAEEVIYNTNQNYLCAGKKTGAVNKLTPIEKLMIANQADGRGRSAYQEKQNNRYILEFQFAKKRKIERLKNICEEGNFEHKVSQPYSRKFSKKSASWNDQTTVYVYLNEKPAKHFNEYFDLENKSYLWCREFIEEVSYWDATRRTETRFKYDSTSKKDSEFVQLVAILAGYRTKFSVSKDTRSEKHSDLYTVNIVTGKDCVSGQVVKKSKQHYSGKIYCVQVPTGMLVVRRNNQVSISGNSGDPCDILCGLNTKDLDQPILHDSIERVKRRHEGSRYIEQEMRGVIELLWETFGGTINSKGYKVLDSHIGCIYGDAITLERAEEICRRLESKGFASSNVVLGIGSFTYNMNTRDTFGFALKTTYGIVNGKEYLLYKDPITDDGTKKSQKGMVAVVKNDKGEIRYVDELYASDKENWKDRDLLQPVFKDGVLLKDWTLNEVKENMKAPNHELQ